MTATIRALPLVETSPVRSELWVMRAVAEALEQLPDNEARGRVLRWAAEYFDAGSLGGRLTCQDNAAPAPQRARRHPTADPSVAVDELSAFFEDHASLPAVEEPPAGAGESRGGVASALRNFIEDFQKLARDWNG